MTATFYRLFKEGNNQNDITRDNKIQSDRAFGTQLQNCTKAEKIEKFLQPSTSSLTQRYSARNKNANLIKAKHAIIENNSSINLQQEQELLKIQEQDKHIPQAVSVYSKQIFEYLRSIDEKNKITDYLKNQDEINEKMRCILVDWLIDVHRKFKMIPETLFLSVHLLDKYLELSQVSVYQLQLLGTTTLFIAAKYEEIYPPALKEFSEVTNNTFSKQEILEMESKILIALDFNLTVASSLKFLDRYARLIAEDKRVYLLGRYIIELALMDYKFTKCMPSNIAASALYLANKIFKKNECWNATIEYHSKYSEKDVRPCAKDLCIILNQAQTSEQKAARRKFSSANYLEISNIQLDKAQ